MAADPLAEARLLTQLEREVGGLEVELAHLTAIFEQETNELRALIHEKKRELKALEDRRAGKITVEVVIAALPREGAFTPDEVARKIGTPIKGVRKHWPHLIEKEIIHELSFRAFGKKTYEYIKPEDPGPAFIEEWQNGQGGVVEPKSGRGVPVPMTGKRKIRQANDSSVTGQRRPGRRN